MKPLKFIILIITSTFILLNNFEVVATETYKVEFILYDISTERYKTIQVQEVKHGYPARYFEPNLIHYEFIKWDQSIVNVTSDMVVKAIYEPKEYMATFIDHDGTVLKEEPIPYGSYVEPYEDPVRDEYIFTGWSSEDFLITGDTVYQAMYKLLEEDVVVEEPNEEDEEPSRTIKFELDELELTYGEVLHYEVPNEVINEKLNYVINYLDKYELSFPPLRNDDYSGVKLSIKKGPLEKAKDDEVTLYVNLDEVTLTLEPSDLVGILIDELESLTLESRYSSLDMLNLYTVGNMDGLPVDRALDISILADDNEALFTEIQVEYKPYLPNGLFNGVNPTDVEFVSYEDGVYKVIDSVYDLDKKVYKLSISKNSTIIPMELTERVIEEVESFDPVDYILSIDRNLLYLYGFGLFVMIYGIVYTIEIMKDRRF